MKFIISFFLILLFSLQTFSQDFNLRHIKTVPEHFPFIVSSVQVYDSGDDPVTGLKDQNFSVSVDSKNCDSVKVQTYKESGLGFNIMLCLDLSGSMKGKPLSTMQNAILKFIDDMRSVDKLGLMGFADDANLISDFSNDKQYLKSKVSGLSTSGNQTALYYGAYKGISKLKENKDNAGKILILIGDGKNESLSSSYSEDDVINLTKEEGIPIFSIGYSKIDPSYLQSFERMSEKSGGKFYNSPSDDDLSKQYEKLYQQILNIYLINYIVVDIAGTGSEHTNVITVRLNNNSKTVSSKFIAPAGVSAYPSKKKNISYAIPLWYYFAGGGIIVFFAATVFFIYSYSKKKKKEKARLEEEKEKRIRDEIESERQKRLELEKKLEDSQKIKNSNAAVSENTRSSTDKRQAESSKTVMINSSGGERTVILKPDSFGNTLRLEILTGPNQGKRFDVSSSGASIGRKDSNSIIIAEDTVSGEHAIISYSDGSFFIRDLGSSNGTFINGKQISNSVLTHGDVFKFGKCEGTISVF